MAFYFDDHHDSLVIRWLDFVFNFPFLCIGARRDDTQPLLFFLGRLDEPLFLSWYFPLVRG